MSETQISEEPRFAVFAEVSGHEKPLLMTGLTFPRLIDDVVVPFEGKEPFFVDGAPVTREKIQRLKIIRQTSDFEGFFHDLHWRLRERNLSEQKVLAEQYHIRLEAMLRECGEDVTSQVVKAFDATIRPRLKDYLPKREELIGAALRVFIEGLRTLGGGA